MGINYLHILIVSVAALLATACGTSDADIPNQKTQIENYLASLDAEYEFINGVYRVVPNNNRSGYSGAKVIDRGDEVAIIFTGRVFSSSRPLEAYPFTSNDPAVLAVLFGISDDGNMDEGDGNDGEDGSDGDGDDPGENDNGESRIVSDPKPWDNNPFWSDTVERFILGSSGRLVKGVTRGLDQCRQGDSVLLFFTSDLGYGDKGVGTVPAGSPLFYIVNILNVVKD